jgi:hypothetical protein
MEAGREQRTTVENAQASENKHVTQGLKLAHTS